MNPKVQEVRAKRTRAGLQAEAEITVTVIPGDYTVTLSGVPETVAQFSEFTNGNCGITATITTVSAEGTVGEVP